MALCNAKILKRRWIKFLSTVTITRFLLSICRLIHPLRQTDSFIIFENHLKSNILAAISNYPNLMSVYVGTLCEYLKSPVSSIEQLRELLNSGSGQLSTLSPQHIPRSEEHALSDFGVRDCNTSEYNANAISTGNTAYQPINTPQHVATQGRKKSLISGLFGNKQNRSQVNPVQQASESGATEALDDLFMPSIMLVGVKTPVKVELVVNKEDYIISKKQESVDGSIQFNKAISRIHCKIIFVGRKYYVVDLGSLNGTYVNGKEIEPQRQVPIALGDKIRFANSDFLIKSV